MEIHVVRPGDTLYGIAVRYQADPAVLQELNGLLPDSVLAVGQTLSWPWPTTKIRTRVWPTIPTGPRRTSSRTPSGP